MTPRQALNNLIAAIHNGDLVRTGLYVGTLQQLSTLQESLNTLQELVKQEETFRHGERG